MIGTIVCRTLGNVLSDKCNGRKFVNGEEIILTDTLHEIEQLPEDFLLDVRYLFLKNKMPENVA